MPCTAAPQEPPNFREMYGFIGNLFDESCRGVDHAAALAGMSASTRSEAGRCLQRLLVNMQVTGQLVCRCVLFLRAHLPLKAMCVGFGCCLA